MNLTSTAFEAGETIPARYTCEAENVSPPLNWQSLPAGAQSLVLICDDPDASNGPWSHWVLYDIPIDVDELAEGLPREGRLPWGGAQGRNDMGNVGYDGPCPPYGSPHRYYFRLYAVDETLELTPGATRAQVLERIHDHVVGQTELMGRYARS